MTSNVQDSSSAVRALGLAFVLALTLNARSSASCAVFEISSGFRDARAVFVGEVLATRIVRLHNDDVRTIATVKVEQRWKGPTGKMLEVSACGGGDVVCTVSMEFKVGRRYLFFAESDPLFTSDCMSQPIEKAAAELQWLQQKPSTKAR